MCDWLMRSCSLRYSVIGGYGCWLASGASLIDEERWVFTDKFSKRGDLEFVQNMPELRFRGLQVYVGFESPHPAQTQARMTWVDFAGMYVKNHGPILTQNFAGHLADQ